MPAYSRQPVKAALRGLNLRDPIDALPQGDYPYLQNVRAVEQGTIISRPGQAPIYGTPLADPVHTVRRLNNLLPGAANPYVRILGAGTKLYTQYLNNVPTQIDTGYSGKPLSRVRYRPDQSTQSWLYLGDANKMAKVNADGLVRGIGLAPPTVAPTSTISSAALTIISDTDNAGVWANTGIAGAASLQQRVPGATTASYVLYDSGATGFCCISPSTSGTNDSWLQPGGRYSLSGSEVCTALQVLNPIAATTIAGIQYDSGSSGLCTIVLALLTAGLDRNSLIRINSAETVRVLSTSIGPDGLYSIRCSTTGTFSIGQSVTGLTCFRTHTFAAFSAGATIIGTSIQSTLTPTTTPVASVGKLTLTFPKDLSNVSGQAVTSDDYIHISLRVDKPGNILFGRLLLDVDSTTNDFAHNLYQKEFRQSDFQSIASGTLNSVTGTQTAITASQVDNTDVPYYGSDIYTSPYGKFGSNLTSAPVTPTSVQIGTGNQAWTELLIRVSDLQRIGLDTTRGLANVAAIGVELTVSDVTVLQFSAWWIAGGYGPDVTPGSPTGIYYRYRYRDSTTGAVSLPGPATRYGLSPARQQIQIGVTASTDPAVNKIDIERLDPTLQAAAPAEPRWTYVGTLDNSTTTYTDKYVAQIIAANLPLPTDVIQPFPTLGKPLSGTVNVCGTHVQWVSGDPFPLKLIAGTVITLAGVAYQLYGNPIDNHTLELTQSAGYVPGSPFSIDSPVTSANPLPWLFGPMEGTTAGFMFGLGDPNNPGTLYFCNGNDPDSCSATGSIEITPPSEPLISGCVWDTYVFVASRDRLFLIQPTFNAANLFSFIQIAGASGCWSMWAMEAGVDGVYYLGRDGIYKATPYYGGKIVSQDLTPLFPHEGASGPTAFGIPTNGFQPVDMTQEQYLRISVADGEVYFDYIDTAGAHLTFRSSPTQSSSLLQDTSISGWVPYTYQHQALLHYFEETPESTTPWMLMPCLDGNVCQSFGTDDHNNPIVCQVQFPYQNYGDTRPGKLIGDQMLSANSYGANGFTLTLLGDFGSRTLAGPVTVGAGDKVRTNYLMDTTLDVLATNVTLLVTWSPINVYNPLSTAPSVQAIYEWESSYVPKPATTQLNPTDWTNDDKIATKYVRLLIIEADTTDSNGIVQTRQVKFQYDGGTGAAAGAPTDGPTFNITHAGQSEQPYAIVPVPIQAHLMRLVPVDAHSWRLFAVRYIYDIHPELSAAFTQWQSGGTIGAKFVQGMILPADTQGQTVTLQIQGDASVPITTLTASQSGHEVRAYSWPPVIAHLMRIAPSGNIRIWEDELQWVYKPSPESAVLWQTQGSSHGFKGYSLGRDALIHYCSIFQLDFAVTVDGSTIHYQLAPTGGDAIEARVYVQFQPMKGHLWSYSITSTNTAAGCRVFEDSYVRLKEWGGDGSGGGRFQTIRPFGAPNGMAGALV